MLTLSVLYVCFNLFAILLLLVLLFKLLNCMHTFVALTVIYFCVVYVGQ